MAEKVAVITGGGQGLGEAFAERLLKQNYKVALLDVNVHVGKATCDAFNAQYGAGRSVFLQCDVRNENQVKHAFSRVRRELGRVDVVVNNAGVSDEGDWEKTLAINLVGVIYSTYAALKCMRRDLGGNGGVIVNIGSTAGLTAVPSGPVYAASKHGVVGFSRSVAGMAEFAGAGVWGVSVLCLCPSYTDTAILNAGTDNSRQVAFAPPGLLPQTKQFIQQMGIMKVSAVVDAFQTLVRDNHNGAVLSITPRGKQYKFPHKLKAAKL